MRVLVVSNFYPPHFVGGYELGCRDVVEGLRARGHDVRVLTSTYGSGPRRDRDVERSLHVNFPVVPRSSLGGWARNMRRELSNVRLVYRACRIHEPDVVYVWNLRFLERSVPRLAQALGYPVCYFVSDHWLADAPPNPRPLAALRRLDLRRVQFVSEHLKQSALAAGYPVDQAEVIPWGVDVDRIPFEPERSRRNRLLHVGRLTPEKGLHTGLEALRIILDESPEERPTMTIVGGPDDDGRAHRHVERLRLENHVRFKGLIQRDELVATYASHDILLFPSVWPEPFSITLLEAMAAGVAVVTTVTGGTAELAEDGVNCLTFAPEDAAQCAENVLRLMRDPKLASRLRRAGRRRIEESFRLETMIDRIERSLRATASDSKMSLLRREGRVGEEQFGAERETFRRAPGGSE